MTWKLLVVAILCSVTAFALTPSSFNTRPVPIFPTCCGEASLQTILNDIYGGPFVNAVTDQQKAAIWNTTGVNPKTGPTLFATYAGDHSAIGFYSDTDPQVLVPIFLPSALAGDSVLIRFNTGANSISIAAAFGDDTRVNVGTWAGISQTGFGIFMRDCHGSLTYCDSTNPTYYTSDNLNPVSTNPAGVQTQARAVTYEFGSLTRWTIAFEDGSDFDYNDRVISLESIMPVPEPASVVLFGGLLVLCASRLRQRKLS